MADQPGDLDADNEGQKMATTSSSVVDSKGHISGDVSNMSHAQLLEMVVRQQEEIEKIKSKSRNSTTIKSGKTAGPRGCKSIKIIESKVERLDDLSLEDKELALNQIGLQDEKESTNAKSLQVLLWQLGCNYCLQDHQFLAVRAIAVGISNQDFPGPMSFNDRNASAKVHKILKTTSCGLKDKGILVADVMGLGKTVEAVAGAILRNAIAKAHNKVAKPTLICTPNEAVLVQWVETLIKAGVEKSKIHRLKTKRVESLKGDIYILCTIYDFQTEARYCFKNYSKKRGAYQSPLFSTASPALLHLLKNQYEAERGRQKNRFRHKKESINECIRRSLAKHESRCKLTFRTFIFDEAHFARNLKTFWGTSAALVSLHSECVLPMSGTPYNNTPQDIATLMTFINPQHASARETWWRKATNDQEATKVLEKIKDWSDGYLIRRGKDVIARQLPPKEISRKVLQLSDMEFSAYRKRENAIMGSLAELVVAKKNGNKRQMRECATKMMSRVASAMLVVAHPILPSGGRDMTLFFSPSRGKSSGILKAQEKRNTCVCCYRTIKARPTNYDADLASTKEHDNNDRVASVSGVIDTMAAKAPELSAKAVLPSKRKRKQSEKIRENDSAFETSDGKNDSDYEVSDTEMEGDHTIEDDGDISEYEEDLDDFDDEESWVLEEEDDADWMGGLEKGRGEILPISRDKCQTGSMGLRHFACETCLEQMDECPRCKDLLGRLQIPLNDDHASNKEKNHAHADRLDRIFCPDFFGGFRASTKLKAVVSTFDKIPRDEKALVVSFYKGGLDLLERMFTDLYPSMGVARFDGDVGTIDREEALELFRTKSKYRVLLMTVKTGGVGLNLVEACHVLLLDRNWNPMVLEQCEDRCYRIGQKKKVAVVYHDSSGTIDEVMAEINRSKATNAGIVLADGPALTANPTFTDTAGLMGRQLHQIRKTRGQQPMETDKG